MIRVLAPAHAQDSHASTKGDTRRNDESLVMNVSYGKTSALLEADAEKLTENFVCRRRPCRRCIEGLAHHGGASSTNTKLLAAVHPRFAVISVGIRNVYRYPRAEVLSRLQQAEVLTYRTDIDSATSFFLDGTGVTSQVADLH
jgi:competence protein ComEC